MRRISYTVFPNLLSCKTLFFGMPLWEITFKKKKERKKARMTIFQTFTNRRWNVSAFLIKPSALYTKPSLIYFILLSNILHQGPPSSARVLSRMATPVWWGSLFDELPPELAPVLPYPADPHYEAQLPIRSPRSALGFQVPQDWFCPLNE